MISREIPAQEDDAFRLAAARDQEHGSKSDFGLERKGKLR